MIKTNKLFLSESKASFKKLTLNETLSPSIQKLVDSNRWDAAYDLASRNTGSYQEVTISDPKMDTTKFNTVRSTASVYGLEAKLDKNNNVILTAKTPNAVNNIKDVIETLDGKGKNKQVFSSKRAVNYNSDQTTDETINEVVSLYISRNGLAKLYNNYDKKAQELLIKIYRELGFAPNRYDKYFKNLVKNDITLSRDQLAALNNVYSTVTNGGMVEVDKGPAKEIMVNNGLFKNNPDANQLIEIIEMFSRYNNALTDENDKQKLRNIFMLPSGEVRKYYDIMSRLSKSTLYSKGSEEEKNTVDLRKINKMSTSQIDDEIKKGVEAGDYEKVAGISAAAAKKYGNKKVKTTRK